MLLVASTDPMRSSDSQETMDVYKSQAKQILAGLTERSPSKCSIDSGPFAFHYVISDAVVYLAMTPKSYPKRAIFRYLGEVAQEFVQEVTATCNGGCGRRWRRSAGLARIQFDRRLRRKGGGPPTRGGGRGVAARRGPRGHPQHHGGTSTVLSRGERRGADNVGVGPRRASGGARRDSLMVAAAPRAARRRRRRRVRRVP